MGTRKIHRPAESKGSMLQSEQRQRLDENQARQTCAEGSGVAGGGLEVRVAGGVWAGGFSKILVWGCLACRLLDEAAAAEGPGLDAAIGLEDLEG